MSIENPEKNQYFPGFFGTKNVFNYRYDEMSSSGVNSNMISNRIRFCVMVALFVGASFFTEY